MPNVHACFPPVVDQRTRVLVLGSLPGARSLAEARYYAHPRNAFWWLLEAVLGHPLVALPYSDRLDALLERGVGLWDTVAEAQRPGSLDADIRLHRASPIGALASGLPALRAIAFNGGTAARIGRRELGADAPWSLIDLPSSSPAYTLPFEAKLARWRAIKAFL